MESQKISQDLNLALEATMRERNQSLDLNTGYEEERERWNVIIQYVGNILDLETEDVQITPLLGNYAVVNLPQSQLGDFARNPQVIFVEKPKSLFFAAEAGRRISCISPVQGYPLELNGRGILACCIDSGIDYMHADFRNPDGSTRILRLWDQSIEGNPPKGYRIGTEYTKDEIDAAIRAETLQERRNLVPSVDNSGHGTAVMGIFAGNGAESQGLYRGVAAESDLFVVKLGVSREGGFPRTTELIQAVDYAVKQGIALGMPTVINLSFGNSYGSHSGTSLVETYLNVAANTGQTTICVGTGNEGVSGTHTSGILETGQIQEVELGIGEYQPSLNVQIWKNYQDQMRIFLRNPSGEEIGPLEQILEAQRFRLSNTELLVYYGEPTPYSGAQEIYMEFLPIFDYLDEGIWTIRLEGRRILDGAYDLWLPGGGVLGEDTRFIRPTPERTLTIPSTALQVISVGAYNAQLQSYAEFSGRGYTRNMIQIKPDLSAPGVNIQTTRKGGGYEMVTGTSFAVPFVSGAAALLMEWGIIRGNDAYLYGEKVKSYLINGTRQLPGEIQWPNPKLGWGVLCLRDSIPFF